jgi:hypothetical protein
MPINNTVPYEVIAAPYEVYWAEVGTAFPDVDTPPGASWALVGTSGSLNYTEAGVTIAHSDETVQWRALGDTGTRKVFRTGEGLAIRFVLADVSLEHYRHALNMNAVTAVPATVGNPGYKWIGLSKGPFVAQVSLLVRGPSAYGDGMASQYQVRIAFQTGNPEPVFLKNEPAALALEYTAVVDPTAPTVYERFGRLVVQTAEAAT